MPQLLLKSIKNVAYESAKGTLVMGTAVVNLVDADAFTLLYLIIAGVIFNFIKEIAKQRSGT